MVKNVKKKFPIGSKVNARVLALDYCSGIAVCSLQKSLVSGVQHLDQLQIEQNVTATVKVFCKAGLVVSLGPTLTGLIPSLYLSDVLLSKPELKYLPGDKVKCRVLRLDPANNKLQLTSKPILVNNGKFPFLSCSTSGFAFSLLLHKCFKVLLMTAIVILMFVNIFKCLFVLC